MHAWLPHRVWTLADLGQWVEASTRNSRLLWTLPRCRPTCRRFPGFGWGVVGVEVGGFDRYRVRAVSAVWSRVGSLGFQAAKQRTAVNVSLPALCRSRWRERVRGFIGWLLRCNSVVALKDREGRRCGCLHSQSRANIRKTSWSALSDAGSNDEGDGPNQYGPTDVRCLRSPGEPHERTRESW